MIQYFKSTYHKPLALLVYLIVNSLFILKYAERQQLISVYFLLAGYNAFFVGLFYFKEVLLSYFDKLKKGNLFFLSLSILTFLAFVAINILVDGNSLNTDRWSAMQVTIKSIISGVYPYNQLDHLGQTSSNLPGLFYIGLPFYLIGKIGFLQPFTFLLGCFLLYRSELRVSIKILIVFIFLCSPAYLWEIFGKSDLVSNILLLIYFIWIWHKKYRQNYFKNISLLAFCCAFLFFTRGVVVIPLTYFLLADFLKISLSKKVLFIVYGVVSLVIISIPILLTLPDFSTLMEHNPFNHQTRFTPFWVQVLFVFLPFITFSQTKTMYNVIFLSFINFTLLLFLSFVIEVLDENFYDALYKSYFDISYLTMILPFAIVVLASERKVIFFS